MNLVFFVYSLEKDKFKVNFLFILDCFICDISGLFTLMFFNINNEHNHDFLYYMLQTIIKNCNSGKIIAVNANFSVTA